MHLLAQKVLFSQQRSPWERLSKSINNFQRYLTSAEHAEKVYEINRSVKKKEATLNGYWHWSCNLRTTIKILQLNFIRRLTEYGHLIDKSNSKSWLRWNKKNNVKISFLVYEGIQITDKYGSWWQQEVYIWRGGLN